MMSHLDGLWRCVVWCVVLCVVGLLGCEGNAPVQPLSDPLFRFNTTLQPTGCDPKQGKAPCKWELKGVVQNAQVVDSGDNPFQNCSSCVFSQKLTIIDGDGGQHQLYYRLPTDEAIFVQLGSGIQLNYTEADRSGQGFALSLRDPAGKLVAAFSSGAAGSLLEDLLGNDIKVIVQTDKEAGRETSDCGTKVFRYMIFQTSKDAKELSPGQTGKISDGDGVAYRVGNVNRFNWEGSRCQNLGATPFAYFIFRAPS